MSITYPPELLPSPDDGEGADVIVCANHPNCPVANAEITRLTARVEELERALHRSEKALRPFSTRVYNDNGDVTVSDMYRLTADDCIEAYFARKIAHTTLSASDNGGRK